MVAAAILSMIAVATALSLFGVSGEIRASVAPLVGGLVWLGLYFVFKAQVSCPHCQKSLFDNYWGALFDPFGQPWHWGRLKSCPWCKADLEDG